MHLHITLLIIILLIQGFILPELVAKIYDVYISRSECLEASSKYFSHAQVYTRRKDRRSPVALYANVTLIHNVNNNATLEITTFERFGNQYKESGFAVKGKFCEFIKSDKLVYPLLRSYSNLPAQCPIGGNIVIDELVIRTDMAPSYFPLADTRLQFHVLHTASRETMLNVYLYFMVVERPRRRTNKTLLAP